MTADTATLASLYREVILTHCAAPVGLGKPIEPTHRAARTNPLCGDDIEVQLRIQNGRIEDAAFSGEACAICLASASLLCEHLPGRADADIALILGGFRRGVTTADAATCPGYLQALLGVRAFPARIACATLPWETAVAALKP